MGALSHLNTQQGLMIAKILSSGGCPVNLILVQQIMFLEDFQIAMYVLKICLGSDKDLVLINSTSDLLIFNFVLLLGSVCPLVFPNMTKHYERMWKCDK
jgi:hypothetical protein